MAEDASPEFDVWDPDGPFQAVRTLLIYGVVLYVLALVAAVVLGSNGGIGALIVLGAAGGGTVLSAYAVLWGIDAVLAYRDHGP